MNYSYIPEIIKETLPIYSNNQTCPDCMSDDTFPLMNMIGSSRYCNKCKNTFNPQISRYTEVIVKK